MSKIMALDLGEQWIGIALSDKLKLFAKPHSTVQFNDLEKNLKDILEKDDIELIVIGLPKTMKGKESIQTKKIIAQKEYLEKVFSKTKFIFWDERLSSKRAENIKTVRTKEEKIQSHAVAAAFILDSYLNYLQFKTN